MEKYAFYRTTSHVFTDGFAKRENDLMVHAITYLHMVAQIIGQIEVIITI